MLMWALPLAIFIATIIDASLVYIYMRHIHPWKDILKDEEAKKAKKTKKMANKRKKAKYFMRRHFADDFI